MIFAITVGVSVIIAQLLSNRYQNKREMIQKTEARINLYGAVFSKLLCSRTMYIEFARLEGYEYPRDFLSFVDMINSNPTSPMAKKYRNLMTDVIGPIQLEVLDIIINNASIFQSDNHSDSLTSLLTDYMMMASSYKIIFSRWKQSDYTVHFSHRRFPPELIDLLHHEFMRIFEYYLHIQGKTLNEGSIKIYSQSNHDDGPTVEEMY